MSMPHSSIPKLHSDVVARINTSGPPIGSRWSGAGRDLASTTGSFQIGEPVRGREAYVRSSDSAPCSVTRLTRVAL